MAKEQSIVACVQLSIAQLAQKKSFRRPFGGLASLQCVFGRSLMMNQERQGQEKEKREEGVPARIRKH